MANLASVVSLEASFEVSCHADVVMVGIGNALENVDVGEMCHNRIRQELKREDAPFSPATMSLYAARLRFQLRRGSLPLRVRLGNPEKLACQDEVGRDMVAANEDWSRGGSNP